MGANPTQAQAFLIFLIGFRNRILVFFQWMWAYCTYSRGARLIYGAFKPGGRKAE